MVWRVFGKFMIPMLGSGCAELSIYHLISFFDGEDGTVEHLSENKSIPPPFHCKP